MGHSKSGHKAGEFTCILPHKTEPGLSREPADSTEVNTIAVQGLT